LRYRSKNVLDEAVSVVSLISSSGGYINIRNSAYILNKIRKGKTCYSEEQVISMLEFLIDKIFVSFGGALIYLSVKSKALAS
jgi:hypothetical protein